MRILSTVVRGVVITGAMLLAVACSKGTGAEAGADDPGMAAGVGGANGAAKVWKELGQYEDVYLKSWKGAFTDPKPAPRDVLDAFNEVGYAVTGPGGFWRSKVSSQWFGCQNDPESAPCAALKRGDKDFQQWDAFQSQIAELGDGEEKRFLARNHKKMLNYISTYVPSEMSESGMKSTGFYKTHLESALSGGGGVTADGSDDL